ncbi:hypothetical protein LQZ19_08780 [Treponema primitia]|uniref:hypothetical protein n=1 Tax=Treponema primitia TaxID=88058 RepID=UPI00397FF1E1
MSTTFARSVTDALMPRGIAWKPAYKGWLDRLLDGAAANTQAVMDDLEKLAYVRNPYYCPAELLSDLEREFGVIANPMLSEKDRREALAAVRYKRASLGTAPKLQMALDKAGFGQGGYGLVVTQNESPAINPGPLVDTSYSLTAHDFPSAACAGNETAHAGYGGGYYLVNGDRRIFRPLYPQAGQICARAFDGSDELSGKQCAGYYTKYIDIETTWPTPDNPIYWPLIFFVGGRVTRNEDGSIASVPVVAVPQNRRQELHRLILRVKPLGIWAAMLCRFV